MSVAISGDGKRVVITTHQKRPEQVKAIMKKGKLIYKTTALRESLDSLPNQLTQKDDTLAGGKSQEPKFSVAPPTDSPEFKAWFGDSKVSGDGVGDGVGPIILVSLSS